MGSGAWYCSGFSRVIDRLSYRRFGNFIRVLGKDWLSFRIFDDIFIRLPQLLYILVSKSRFSLWMEVPFVETDNVTFIHLWRLECILKACFFQERYRVSKVQGFIRK